MTDDQRIIAEAAIDRRQAATFNVIHEEISRMTGTPLASVKGTLDSLVQEFVLKRCATPARNALEGPIPPDEVAWGWYEKGELWPSA